jgi:hypothetical protein
MPAAWHEAMPASAPSASGWRLRAGSLSARPRRSAALMSVALKGGEKPMLVKVKSTARGPYEHFGPAERARLADAAEKAGAAAFLCWRPPQGKPS